MNSKEEYICEISGKIIKIKTAVKDGETYFYLFIKGTIAKIATGEDDFGMVFSEEEIDSSKHCYELKLADNEESILLKEGDLVCLESSTNKGCVIPSTLKQELIMGSLRHKNKEGLLEKFTKYWRGLGTLGKILNIAFVVLGLSVPLNLIIGPTPFIIPLFFSWALVGVILPWVIYVY